MRILTALTYYRPHYSGLTIYAERMARSLAARGHAVTVLTSQYSPELARREHRDGVEIVRLPVWARVSKGVLMPGMVFKALAFARRADVVHLHLPQLDAAPVSLLARLLGKPVVLTYHCDLKLPHGGVHWLANQVSHLANHISARAANVIVTNTQDYAENSSFLRGYLRKVRPILPPAEITAVSQADRDAFRRKAGIQPGQRIIGMAARLASEKGVEYLAQALPLVMEKHPSARVIFVGQHENVFGEEQYAQRLRPLISSLGDHWRFMGNLNPLDWSAFFHECEVTVLPSLNSTESFGLVQVESMMAGTPVVASDLPGVRQPVALTGMGRTVPAGDAQSLARAIIAILDQPEHFGGNPQAVRAMFSPQSTARTYEGLFEALVYRGEIHLNAYNTEPTQSARPGQAAPESAPDNPLQPPA
jgi:glycosyltransferase involved in cell wall biosynthesis